jgi:hypothetical protein
LRWPRALLALVPSSAAQSWSTVRSRYLFLSVGDDADPGEIPVSEMLRELGSAVQEAELVRTLPEGTLLYRARSHGRNDYPTTASELGAPPAQYLDDLEAVTLTSGKRLPFSFMFLFLGALPCAKWLADTVARDDDGFILTGAAANMDHLLETTIAGVFAAGDVRSGSTKRCATAVGEGAMAVQFVHAHLPRTRAVEEVT